MAFLRKFVCSLSKPASFKMPVKDGAVSSS